MNGARFVHGALEELGREVLVADAQKVKGPAPPGSRASPRPGAALAGARGAALRARRATKALVTVDERVRVTGSSTRGTSPTMGVRMARTVARRGCRAFGSATARCRDLDGLRCADVSAPAPDGSRGARNDERLESKG
jgi:hypothetical protein